jgi:hypothetical protein
MRAHVLLFSAFVLTGCIPMALKAKRYSGDGLLTTCSNLLMQGYAIDFSRHPSDQPFSATYKVSQVPQIGRDPYVYLRFPSHHSVVGLDDTKKRVTASFHVDLSDASGAQTHSLDLPLAEAIWTDAGGAYAAYRLYDSQFYFAAGQSYSLHVSYTPGAVPPPGTEVYVQIDGCAYY